MAGAGGGDVLGVLIGQFVDTAVLLWSKLDCGGC